MGFENQSLIILYGSQTGNAQDVAERIWRESKRFFFVGSVNSMDEYNISELVLERCAIFVCSTTGQGEEPHNMKCFWKFLLRKNLPNNSLSNLKYAVLGLGDSSYVKFNFVAKRLNKRLAQLGGQILIPLGLGDDQHDLGYDAAVDPWINLLWQKLGTVYPLPIGIEPLEENLKINSRWNVTANLIENISNVCIQEPLFKLTRTKEEFDVTVKDIIRTTAESHFQDVRLIKLGTAGQIYLPGDVVVIRPRNSPERVKEFKEVLEMCGVNIAPHTVFTISEMDPKMPVPEVLRYKVTFQQLCEEYFNLNAVPRRYAFGILAQLTDSDIEKEKLLEFTTAEGQNDLYSYCNRPRRNIVEVLQDFPHATKNIAKDVLFDILTPIKPREFSIASSCNAQHNEIYVLFAVVRYKTKLVKERIGLCSNYLADLKIGDKLIVSVRKGSFSFPNNVDVPIIMVGPGTGISPFCSYIFDRDYEGTASANNLILFFGCRGEAVDFHFKNKLHQLQCENKLNLICAFSRDQEHKIYVQHKIVEYGDTVWNALKQGAFIYIAGNAKNMPQQVRDAFLEVCCINGNMTKERAEYFINQMERSGRYQNETWS